MMTGSHLQGALTLTAMLLGGSGLASAAPLPAAPAGLVLTIDPATGRWGPPAGGELAFRWAMSRPAAAPVEVEVAPDGTLSVELGGRFRQAVVARVGVDGALSWSCAQAAAAPLPFLVAPATSTVPSLPGEVR